MAYCGVLGNTSFDSTVFCLRSRAKKRFHQLISFESDALLLLVTMYNILLRTKKYSNHFLVLWMILFKYFRSLFCNGEANDVFVTLV